MLRFGKEFTQLLLLAFVIAAPFGWWLMNNWLQNFSYKISLGAGVFILTILIVFLVSALTTGFQALKASLANPVESLRNE